MNQKLNEDWMDMSQIDLDAIKLECTIVDADWLQKLFPEKEKNKLKQWLSVLKSEEFDKIDDLAMLDASGWELLSLPLGVKIKIKSFVDEWKVRHATVTEKTSADLILDHNEQTEQPISQIDCILIDISSSMRARSNIDADKTREDVSKMLFHTMVDKLICLELSHAVGLVAFGASILPIAITRQYESFHDQLGRLDANQNSTRLYDAIYDAADLIEEFTKTNKTSILKTLDFENEKADTNSTELLQKRIFVLTDGEDNASQKKPWQVAKHLQEKSIILDAIPLAGSKNILQSICAATSGLCFDIVDQEQGINLFEREATLHVAYREVETTTTTIEDGTQIIEKKKVIQIIDENSLKSLEIEAKMRSPVLVMQSAAPKSLFSACMTFNDISKALSEVDDITNTTTTKTTTTTTTITNNNKTSNATYDGSKGASKRILKEYSELLNNPIENFKVFISAESISSWKIVLHNLPFAPYVDGTWLLTVEFPSQYPFKSPKIKFLTPIFHCNISVDGHICLDILQSNWSPNITISKVLNAIKELLKNPNSLDPLDAYKGALYNDFLKNNLLTYFDEASKHTKEKASEDFECLKIKYFLNN